MKNLLANKSLILSLLCVTLFVIIHLTLLSQIPYFEDEALFTGWSRDMRQGISSLFIPLANGIGPLYSWITLIPIYFIHDHFFAGRLVSMCAGLMSSLIVVQLSQFITTKKISFLAGILYASFPITFVYHRLAILESMLTMFILLMIYFYVKNLTKTSSKNLVLFGISLFLALLTKQIAFIFIPGLILGILFSYKDLKSKSAGLACILLAYMGVSILYFPFRDRSLSFLSDYVFIPTSFGDLFFQMKKNLWLLLHWLTAYFPFGVLVSAALGMVVVLHKRNSLRILFFCILVTSAIGIIISDKLFFPRHIMVITPFILLMSILFLDLIYQKFQTFGLVLIFILLVQNAFDSAQLVLYPGNNSVMAKEDIFQLYEDWTSGIGLSNIITNLNNLSEEQVLTVWVDSSIYYYGLPLLIQEEGKILTRWISEKLPETENCSSKKNEYILLNKSVPINLNLKGCHEKVMRFSPRHEVKIYY